MNRHLAGLAVGWLLAFAAWADDDGPVSIARFITDLARTGGFEVIGLSKVGNDTFSPFARPVPPDRSLARALAHYNYIVNYADGHITRVTILSAKGDSEGAMPDDSPAPPAEDRSSPGTEPDDDN